LNRVIGFARRKLISLLRSAGITLIRTSDLESIAAQAQSNAHTNLPGIASSLKTDALELIKAATMSRSQLGQELIALCLSDFQPCFFVEFGATDGVSLSNTYALEKRYGWSGILAEPGKQWHALLQTNRDCIIDQRAVYSITAASLGFVEDGELGTLKGFEGNDLHRKIRKSTQSYVVESVSLNDLLDFHQAPSDIGFISIDTEGSELEILSTFEFSRYRVKFFAIEHNYSSTRPEIHKLMAINGYTRVLEELSAFDDWYVANDQLHRFVQTPL
jgi:FkbM family methyltransferase